MSPWLALLVWWSSFLNWNEAWLPTIDKIEIVWEQEPGWPGQEGMAWYQNGVMHIRTDHPEYKWRLPAAMLHEIQHYLAHKAELGDWEKFSYLTMKEVRRGDYSRHQLLSVKALSGDGRELHAELPIILQGEIPAVLQAWYPWFELKGMKADESPGRSASEARYALQSMCGIGARDEVERWKPDRHGIPCGR